MKEQTHVKHRPNKIQTEKEAISWIHRKAVWNPIWFFEEILIVKPSEQQKNASRELVKMMKAKLKVSDFLKLSEEEYLKIYKKIPTEIEHDYASKLGISIRSGNGTGKDAWCAWVKIWFLFCFEGCKMIVTAPTQDQLRSILWAEVGKWIDARTENGEYRFILRELYAMNATYVYIKEKNPKGSMSGNFSMARTATVKSDGESETLAGNHADYMILIIEEASGVEDAVFKPIERTMTSPCNLCILIFNPTKRSGYAYRTHYGDLKDKYLGLHWDARDSENVNPQHIKNIEDTYGKESNQYRISVMGEPPLVSDSTLIPYEWAIFALERQANPGSRLEIDESDPLIISCDVARLGKNKSVILVRKGPVIIDIRECFKMDTVEVAFACEELAGEYPDYDALYIDTVGIGGGVYDILKRALPRIISVDVSKTSDDEQYDRVRDKLWWKTREAFEKGRIAIADTVKKHFAEKLVREISDVRLSSSMLSNSKVTKVESKLAMKARGVTSPDFGDALMMSYFKDDNHFRRRRTAFIDPYEQEKQRQKSQLSHLGTKRGWMGA